MRFAAFNILCTSTAVFAFSSPASQNARINCIRSESLLFAESTERVRAAIAEETENADVSDSLRIPLSYDEMILQASQCMADARDQGLTRQIIRVLLPRDASADRLGVQFEADAQTADRTAANRGETRLVPTDESWQGGIMQLYRAASPTARDILRKLSPSTATTGVPPRIVEDRSIDESGVDGVGLMYTRIGGGGGGDEIVGENDGSGFGFFGGSVSLPALADDDACVFVQPTQEVADAIDELSSTARQSLVALINPQWRDVDDALDSASKSDSIFGALASFLGGKGSMLRRLEEQGYCPSYTLEGYVCKGGNIRLIKRFDSDWVVFAENDSGDEYVRLGTMTERPSYQDVEKMLDDKGVGYKYARDLGMAPKL